MLVWKSPIGSGLLNVPGAPWRSAVVKLPWLIFIEKSYAGLSVARYRSSKVSVGSRFPRAASTEAAAPATRASCGPEQVALGERLGRRLGERQPLLRV